MANVQYYTTVDWDQNIREVGTDETGLAINAIATTAGAPANTSGKWLSSAIVQNEVTGVAYINSGSTLAPSFTPIGGSGTPSLPVNSIQYNNAGSFFGDSEATRDPITHETIIGATTYGVNFPVFTGVGLNDMQAGGVFTGSPLAVYTITITGTGATDSFSWTCSTGGGAAGVLMTGGSQLLNNGVGLRFQAITGHTLGDVWTLNIISLQSQFLIGDFGGQISGIGTAYTDVTNNITGINIFGNGNGSPDSCVWGFVSIGSNTRALVNAFYDGSETSIDISTSDLTNNVEIEMNSQSGITFNYAGGQYTFPQVQGGVNTVLTDVAGNGVLSWAASSGLAIGGTITGSTNNEPLYINTLGTLQQSAHWTYNDLTDDFNLYDTVGGSTLIVAPSAKRFGIGDLNISNNGNYINIDDASQVVTNATGSFWQVIDTASNQWARLDIAGRQWFFGDISGSFNSTVFQIRDTPTPQIFGEVNGAFLISQPTGVGRLIDGNTTTFNLYLGDVSSAINRTNVQILDSLKRIDINASTSGGSGGLIKIGDTISFGNDTMLQLDDFSKQVFVQTNGDFGVQTLAGQRIIDADMAGGLGTWALELGDVNSGGNGTILDINDGDRRIDMKCGGEERSTMVGKIITLPDNTVTSVFEVALPAGAMTGGFFTANVTATDGVDFQAHSDHVTYAAVNKGGVYTTTIQSSNGDDAIATSAGTLTVVWSITTGANKIIVEVNANSSLAAPTIQLRLNIINNGGQAITIL